MIAAVVIVSLCFSLWLGLSRCVAVINRQHREIEQLRRRLGALRMHDDLDLEDRIPKFVNAPPREVVYGRDGGRLGS